MILSSGFLVDCYDGFKRIGKWVFVVAFAGCASVALAKDFVTIRSVQKVEAGLMVGFESPAAVAICGSKDKFIIPHGVNFDSMAAMSFFLLDSYKSAYVVRGSNCMAPEQASTSKYPIAAELGYESVER